MSYRHTAARLCLAIVLAGGALLTAQQLPSEPAKQFGASITGSFEGWYDNPDGSHSFLVGYLNRNRAHEVDIPIGPNNSIEPGGPDMGQPTHFLPGRQVGVFIVTVPKSFTLQQRLTWKLTVNGQTTSIPLRTHVDYNISPMNIAHDPKDPIGNTPPVVRLDEGGPRIQGPLFATPSKALERSASVSAPLLLPVWVEDDAKYSSGSNAPMLKPPPPATLSWAKYRGPGAVTFDKEDVELQTLAGGKVAEPFSAKGSTTVKFSEPGDYMLSATANDYSGDGGGGELCCWTTVLVKVRVTP